MKDYYYFKQKDLLINVQVNNNTATYQTHRKVELDEMIFVEHYIRNVVLGKSKEFECREMPVIKIEYSGPDDKLMEEHKMFVEQHGQDVLPKMPDFFKDLNFMETKSPRPLGDIKFPGSFDRGAFESARDDFYNKQDKQDEEIKDLKERADQEFCFDRIGDILRDRNENHSDDVGYRMEELVECVKEYNALSNKKVKITDLIN